MLPLTLAAGNTVVTKSKTKIYFKNVQKNNYGQLRYSPYCIASSLHCFISLEDIKVLSAGNNEGSATNSNINV